jgi:hypothetical protein
VSARVLMPLVFPEFNEWFADSEWIVSAGLVTVVLTGYLVSAWITRQSSAEEIIQGAKPCVG